MLQFILKRLLNVPLLLILATLFAFVIIQSGPGNVIDNKTMSANLGPRRIGVHAAQADRVRAFQHGSKWQ